MYLIGSILDISQVVWFSRYCLKRWVAHANAQQVRSKEEYFCSQLV